MTATLEEMKQVIGKDFEQLYDRCIMKIPNSVRDREEKLLEYEKDSARKISKYGCH